MRRPLLIYAQTNHALYEKALTDYGYEKAVGRVEEGQFAFVLEEETSSLDERKAQNPDAFVICVEEREHQKNPAMPLVRTHANLALDFGGYANDEKARILLEILKRDGKPLIRFTSFGHKYGTPNDLGVVLDCRDIPNPFWVDELRSHNGNESIIVDWLERHEETSRAYEAMVAYLDYAINEALRLGRTYIHIGVGCTGGQHRSVYMASRLAKHYQKQHDVLVTHRETWRFCGE